MVRIYYSYNHLFVLDILEKPLALRSELCVINHSVDLVCVLLTVVLMIVAHVLFLQYSSFIKAIITKHTPVPQQVH